MCGYFLFYCTHETISDVSVDLGSQETYSGHRVLLYLLVNQLFFRLKHSAFFRLGIGNWTKTLNVDG